MTRLKVLREFAHQCLILVFSAVALIWAQIFWYFHGSHNGWYCKNQCWVRFKLGFVNFIYSCVLFESWNSIGKKNRTEESCLLFAAWLMVGELASTIIRLIYIHPVLFYLKTSSAISCYTFLLTLSFLLHSLTDACEHFTHLSKSHTHSWA